MSDQTEDHNEDEVVDYTKEDFAARGSQYDAIIDFVGDRALRDCRKALRPEGRYVYCGAARGNWIAPIVATLKVVLFGLWTSQAMKPARWSSRRHDTCSR